MNLEKTVIKIGELIANDEADKKFILSLYKSLFKSINLKNKADFQSILSLSDKLLDYFLRKHDYNAVFDIYKIEHNYFTQQFQDSESEKLNSALKEANVSENGIKKILDYLLVSFEVINNRWDKIVNFLILLSEEKDFNQLKEVVEKQIKPLLYKSNFHFIHTIHFVKHNYEELQKVYDKISELSLTDSLTGLKNRRYFFITYENLFYMANRRKMSICFVMMDIDDFKKINDTYGHQKGDEVLVKIALLVSNFFRRSDIVIRYGGDEILIMLTDAKSYDVKLLVSQLLAKIKNIKFSDNGANFYVTMSAGIYCQKIDNCYKPSILKGKMIKKADEAMYLSKKEGKNKVTVYEEK